jgi:Transposase
MRPRMWVGIDVGKTSHHACAVDETGEVVWTQKLVNEQRAIEQVIDRAHQSAERVRWAIDLTSPMALMLITVLLGGKQSVVYVPGRVVNTMTHAFRGEGKTDAKDARVIAETARMRSDLREVTMPDELVVELSQLTGYRADLMADWVRGVNRLRALLGAIFPTLEAAFNYSTRTPLILVAALCTPGEIRAAGIDGVTAHLVESKRGRPGLPRPRTPRSPSLSSSPWRCRARPAPPRWSSGWRTGCSTCTGRLTTSTKPSRGASETIRTRGSSSRCPASALTWVRSSWSSLAVIWPPSLPQDDWPRTPDWFLRQGIPAV